MEEREMESERVEQLSIHLYGKEWIEAIAERSFERIERICHPGVLSRLMTPKKYFSFDNREDLSRKIRQWFGDCTAVRLEHARVETVGERFGIFYRFFLQEEGIDQVVEQQVYCTLQDGLITELELLCSGFHADGFSGQPAPAVVNQNGDALLVMSTGTDSGGSTCALLTPAIKARLRELQSGQVLEVRVDDLSARDDVAAWCRLSGNQLIHMRESGPELLFFIKKK